MPHIMVIGCGSIGRRHLANLRALGVESLSAVDPQEQRLQEALEAVPGIQTYTDLDKALAQPDLDGAVICPPTAYHIPMAKKVVDRGLNSLVEKPLSHTLDGVDQVGRGLEKRGLWMMVGYSMRFHPGIATMKRLLEEQAIGRVMSVRAECGQYLPDWHPWEDYRSWYMSKEDQGGGAILDISHEIDYLRWFFGDVDSLTGVVTRASDLEMDTDDLSEVILQFRSGVLGSLHLDLLQRDYRRTCDIVGTEGTVSWDYRTDAVRLYTTGSGEWQALPYEFERNAAFLAELEHFLACIRGEAAPLVSFEDGRRTLEVVLAAKRSSKERRWVSVHPGE